MEARTIACGSPGSLMQDPKKMLTDRPCPPAWQGRSNPGVGSPDFWLFSDGKTGPKETQLGQEAKTAVTSGMRPHAFGTHTKPVIITSHCPLPFKAKEGEQKNKRAFPFFGAH